MKQFIRGKPIRFGYKVWCLNTPQGYLINFEVYQGRNLVDSNDKYDKCFGKSTAPLLKFIDQLPKLPFSFFFDNLFCSVQLLLELERRNLGGTETMRPNRISKTVSLPDRKSFQKADRGDADWCSATNNNIGITIWKDNKPVIIGSNFVATLAILSKHANVFHVNQNNMSRFQFPTSSKCTTQTWVEQTDSTITSVTIEQT